ncbi:MAG: hypothetical protein WC807_17335 [Hyphomicrobium sp.]|jgi:hypothetical protein
MIDDFRLDKREPPFDPLSVVLFKALQVMAFLFFIALIAISTQKNKGKIESKAEFLISMSWPDNHPDDFDLFVQDPLANVVWYRRRDVGFMVLERDNRGGANDFIVVGGQKVHAATRQELVSIRGIVPGEFTVNVYHFTAQTSLPVPVTITVEKLNPVVTTVAKETIEIVEGGAEKTAVRFTIDAKGDVVKVDRTERSILQTFFSASRDGGPL